MTFLTFLYFYFFWNIVFLWNKCLIWIWLQSLLDLYIIRLWRLSANMDVDDSRRPKWKCLSNLSENWKSQKYQLSRAKLNTRVRSQSTKWKQYSKWNSKCNVWNSSAWLLMFNNKNVFLMMKWYRIWTQTQGIYVPTIKLLRHAK